MISTTISKNKEFIQTCLKFAQARLSPPTFAQIASLAALETPEKYFNDVPSCIIVSIVVLLANFDGINPQISS